MLFLLGFTWLFVALSYAIAADFDTVINPILGSVTSVMLLLLSAMTITLAIYYRNLQHSFSKLKQQHKQFSSFLHHSSQLIAVLDHAMQPLFINSYLLALTKQSTIAAAELQFDIYPDEQSAQSMKSLIQQPLTEQAHWQGELWIGCRNTLNRRSLTAAITRLGDTEPVKYLFIAQDTTNDIQQQQWLLQQQIKDPDTNLLIPTIFKEYLTNAIASCNEQHPKLAVMVIKTSCALGFSKPSFQTHLTNRLLVLADHIKSQQPKGTILAQYKRDSLALLIPAHCCSNNIDIFLNRLAHNILGSIEQSAAPSLIDKTCIGIAVFPDDADTATTILTSAAAALATASQLGVNRFQFANNNMQQCSAEYFCLEAELTKAIAEQHIEVYFQPKLNISNKNVVGYEALARWHCPKRGLLTPAAFISMADETGLIVNLDHLVFAKCCQQYIDWQPKGINRGRIAINIASLSFQQADFVERLTQQLAFYQVSAEYFALELDEDIFLSRNLALTTTLQQLVSLGFHLTLDNFGEGLASIKNLRHYPIHSIKIAKNYIVNIEHDAQQRNITASLIRLAAHLHLDVIANGVENDIQAYLLHVMGCDILQGHLISKALPATEIPALLTIENQLIRSLVS
jgi:EAL domain-containing protein (putative c-di-GMP-specific phosphodiesterase class I)/GGDEF domain-containing protein